MRLPVAAKIALQRAGAKGGTGGSPTPVGSRGLSTMCTSISLALSANRKTMDIDKEFDQLKTKLLGASL